MLVRFDFEIVARLLSCALNLRKSFILFLQIHVKKTVVI